MTAAPNPALRTRFGTKPCLARCLLETGEHPDQQQTQETAMRILIAGATGLTGRALTRKIQQSGRTPVALVREGSDLGVLPEGVETRTADLTNLPDDVAQDMDAVIFAAGSGGGTSDEMTDKIDFMQKSDNTTQRGLALAMAKSVFNEGVALFASFVMLLNFQRVGKMKGMGKVVEWSIRDESMHVEGNSRLFKAFVAEHPKLVDNEFKKEIYVMAKDIVKLEDKFIELAYEMGEIEGLTMEEVKTYIRYITDRRLLQLGLKTNFKVKNNPLPWLEWILNGADHTNFFENRVTEYEVAGLTGSWDNAYGN